MSQYAEMRWLTQYATVEKYWGCYEVMYVLRPYLVPMAAGFGFGVVWLLDKMFCRQRWVRP